VDIADSVAKDIKRLLRTGRSPSEISRRVGLSVDQVIRFAKKNRLAHATDAQRKQALALLRQGMSVRQVGHAVGMSHTWVVKLADKNGITLNQVRMSSDRRQRLQRSLADGDLLQVAATKTGCSKSTASLYRRRMMDQLGGVSFRRTRRAHRCPVHGLIHVVPCVACAAMRRR
jgi:transposase